MVATETGQQLTLWFWTDHVKEGEHKFAKISPDALGIDKEDSLVLVAIFHLFIEFPRDKYRYTQEALALWKHLKNKNDKDAKMDLCCVEGKIRVCVDYHKMNDATENRIVHKIYHVSLDKEEQETWMKFRELAESIQTALEGIRYPIREEDLMTVKKDDNLAGFIGEYVVMPLTSPVGWYSYIPPDFNL
ncbi:hypothetical protein Tco_0760180 [Tanacetum coccineum]